MKEETNTSDFYSYTSIYHVPGEETWSLKGIHQISGTKPRGSLNFLAFTKTWAAVWTGWPELVGRLTWARCNVSSQFGKPQASGLIPSFQDGGSWWVSQVRWLVDQSQGWAIGQWPRMSWERLHQKQWRRHCFPRVGWGAVVEVLENGTDVFQKRDSYVWGLSKENRPLAYLRANDITTKS